MRKLYTLVAGLLLCLVITKTFGQQSGFNLTTNPDLYNNSHSFTNAVIPDGINIDHFQNNASSDADEQQVTCQANFEEIHTPNSTLSKKFEAIPWHSEQNKPVYICWKFGDGKDTCIQYSNTFTGPYTVVHYYQHPGNYEVCVRIVYQGGCEATKCKAVLAGDVCKADFEKLTFTSVSSPLFVTYKALPWNSSNKKPKKICWKFGDGKDTCIEYPESKRGIPVTTCCRERIWYYCKNAIAIRVTYRQV